MTLEGKSLDRPDETRTFGHGKIDVVKVGRGVVNRTVFEPGWKWSNDVKPIVGTESCEVDHLGYVVSGRLKVVMNDGAEADVGPGDAFAVSPGHDAWVVGDEPCVIVDFDDAGYAQRPS